jgi:hypothetical protein
MRRRWDGAVDRLRTGRSRGGAWAAIAGVAAAAPVLAWWTVGDLSEVPREYAMSSGFGPYELGAAPGRVALAVAVPVLAAALADLVRRKFRGEFGWQAWIFVALVATAAAAGGAAWRVVTAGVEGANIGGGFVLLAAPGVIPGLLVIAGHLPPQCRPVPVYEPYLSLGAAALAVTLFVAPFVAAWPD